MMKKVLRLTIICAMLLALSGCCLQHSWKDADCEHPKTCEKCGKTEGEALGHDWKEATCEEPRTCSRCGAREGEALGHDFPEWKLESMDFLNAEGTYTRECTRCGAEQEEQRPLETLYEDGEFLCTVEEFTERLQNEQKENILYLRAELRKDSTDDLAAYSILIDGQPVGGIVFMDAKGENLRGDEEDTGKFAQIMAVLRCGGNTELEENMSCVADLIRACDPTKTTDSSAELCTTFLIISAIRRDGMCKEDRNGLHYTFGTNNQEIVLHITGTE